MIEKSGQKLEKRIMNLQNGEFLEDDIELLLIQIREILPLKSILREVCNFIAHRERNMGICHQRIDSRYAKMLYIENGLTSILTNEYVEKHRDKPWSFFSDQILNYFDFKKADKKKFELTVINGLDEIDGADFEKYYRLNKRQVSELIKNNYELKDGFYILNPNISNDSARKIEDILKYIRGTITGKAVFSDKEISEDLIKSLRKVCKENNINLNISKIRKNLNDIILSILFLLHDSKLKLFDGNAGHCYLSIYSHLNSYSICLMAQFANTSTPLITTEIIIDKYLTNQEADLSEFDHRPFPLIFLNRNSNGDLKLNEMIGTSIG